MTESAYAGNANALILAALRCQARGFSEDYTGTKVIKTYPIWDETLIIYIKKDGVVIIGYQYEGKIDYTTDVFNVRINDTSYLLEKLDWSNLVYGNFDYIFIDRADGRFVRNIFTVSISDRKSGSRSLFQGACVPIAEPIP